MKDKPCFHCHANCCKHYDVFIEHEDVKRLYDIVGDFTFLKKIEYEKSFGYVPKFNLWEEGVKKKWVICLDNPNRICLFLRKDTCQIYNNRPYICRTYPFIWDKNRVKETKNLCPVKWKVDDEKREEIKNEYNQLLLNFLTFETICDDWNKMVTKEDNFENFLIFVYNHKIYEAN